ncbi:transposon Tf2-9 polyprotein [Trichonephila clavipes]|nr:transposon Tf2-9 polyprotein [Trichonephila clavipes]
MKSAFNQIPVHFADRHKMAFSTPDGDKYQFNRLCFGLKNSPKAFQSIAQEVLGDSLHHGALVYIDDIILFTKTIDEHFELLGFVVTPEGILIDKDKSVSINEFPVPKDQKQIKSFLGCCNFYRRYIKNFAKRALPLTNLLRKDTPFEWTSETQEAFDDIKKAILNPPVLALPDQNAELQITTDASSRGIGAVLEQKYPNSEGRKFKVFTDHKPLAGFVSNKNPSSKILRWKLALEEFNYDIHYIRRSLNSVADHLSRYINNITIALPDSKDLIDMQREDSVLRTIIQKIDQNDVSPQISNYFINGEGLLCHLSKRPSRSPRSNTTRKQVCIPHCLKAKILESVHSEYGGHLKFFKTYHRLSENFFWHNMYKDTKNFVRSCTICLSRKNAFKIPPAPHQPVEQSTEPGETCHMDIFGPLKTTLKGNSYVLSMIDAFTKYIHIVPLPDIRSSTISKTFFDNYIVHRGCPHKLVVDNATYFKSSEFVEFCRVMGIHKRHISSYSAHVNGRVEKPNQSLANILASISQNTNDWDEQLPHTMLALNSEIHEATYTSPFFLEHGRDIRLSYTYEKNSDTPQNKPKFEGPYRVIERFSNVNYRVQHVEQLRKRFNTHVNRMIPFIKRFSYLHLNNLDDLQPDETEVKGIVPSPRRFRRDVEALMELRASWTSMGRTPTGFIQHRKTNRTTNYSAFIAILNGKWVLGETSIDVRKFILRLFKKGKSYREIAKIVGRSHSWIQKIIGRFKSDGLIENKSGRGRKRILSDVAKRKVLKDIRIDPKLSAVKLATETSPIMGRSVSAETVRNVIRHAVYSRLVARKKPFINLQNQKKRLEFAKTH